MKLDTSSYYPDSPLDNTPYMPHGREDSSAGKEDSESSGPEIENEGHDEPQPQPDEKVTVQQEVYFPPGPVDKFLTGASHLLSWVFVPLLMPVYAALLAFSYSMLAFTGYGTRFVFTLIIFLFNVAVPSLLVILLKKMGVVQDIGLNNRKERFIPYIICIACLIGTALFLGYKHAPQWIVWFYMGAAAAGIIEVTVNHWWKISVHAAGVAGVVALLTHLAIFDFTLPGLETWLYISLVVAGLLGSARIWLGRHTLLQVLAGYAVGFATVYGLMLLAPSTSL